MGGKINAEDMRSLTDAGVLGFICKYDSLHDTLPTAIQWAHRGRLYLSPEALVVGRDPDLSQALTPRLRQVLELIERGLYVQDIALMRGVPVRRIYWVNNKLHNRFGADTNEQLMIRAAEEGFLP